MVDPIRRSRRDEQLRCYDLTSPDGAADPPRIRAPPNGGIGHLRRLRYLGRVKFVFNRAIIIAIACGLAACATDNMIAATAPVGGRFSDNGKLTLHRGEPCTSQIMFDFHPAGSRSVVWLAAGAHDSQKLTQAARQRRRVRISGVWRKGRHPGCTYVDVIKLAVETTWWNKIWKQ